MDDKKEIKALIMDVDGTLTDGGIYIGNDGEIMKRFHVKDGYGIHNILPELGITPIVITGRSSAIIKIRCRELGIEYLIQESSDKVYDMKNVLGRLKIPLAQTAYIGDDLNDFDAMQLVGIKGCPRDAVDEIKKIADYVANSKGGEGAVREFIDWLNGELG